MAIRTPLVIIAGQVQQLPSGDSLAQSYGFPYSITSNIAISAGYGVEVIRAYPLTVSAGVTLTIGAAAVLQIE